MIWLSVVRGGPKPDGGAWGAMGRPKAAVTGKASSFWAKGSMAGSQAVGNRSDIANGFAKRHDRVCAPTIDLATGRDPERR